jgi:trans-2,3-dihydro-3-hydroxyanthranilate isomerase
MEKHDFYIVDVFAEEKYAGNQLAVIRGAKKLSTDQMQRTAREMNYSETTFILKEEEKDGGYDVRIFTPETELPFAGHPTLGTAYVVQQEIIKEPIQKVVLNLKVGQIPVTISYTKKNVVDVLWMKQIKPAFGQIFDVKLIPQVLSLDAEEIDQNFPVQDVSTGVPFIIVPLKSLDALKRTQVAREKYFQLVNTTPAKCILIFCTETYKKENDLCVRVFADYYGVTEDPATGSANGCLAGYLVKHRYLEKDKINLRVEQGYEIGRPSLLLLRAERKQNEIDVFVGGRVIMVAKGELI